MKLTRSRPPYISHPDTSMMMMTNVIIALTILYAMSFFFYGVRAVLLGVFCVITAELTEFLSMRIYGKKMIFQDLSPVITGMLIPLMLPASVPFSVPIIATIFGIFVVKNSFGGTGANIFNPAAAGLAFVFTSYPASVLFMYPEPMKALPIFAVQGTPLFHASSYFLLLDSVPPTRLGDILINNSLGPMGSTNLFVLVSCVIFLILRRTVRWQTPVVFLATTSAIAYLFPRAEISGQLSLGYEMLSGLLLFGAVFVISDPVTTPKRSWASVFYAFVAGIVVMIFRHVSRIEESFVFALLIMNASVRFFDITAEYLAGILRRRKYGSVK